MHLVLAALADTEVVHEPVAMWAFLAIGAIALFGIFLPITTWLEARRKEREAYYRSETMRRVTEASGEGAKAAIEFMREEERLRLSRRREGLKIGGLVNVGVGIGLAAMLRTLLGPGGPYMVGSIPFLIGVALLVYVFFMVEPIQP